MQPMRVQLIARQTADGLMSVHDHVPLGTIYEVDADSVQLVKGFNLEQLRVWKRLMVQDVATGAWLPVEVLGVLEEDP